MALAKPKPLHWIASSLDDMRSLPDEVQDDLGYQLGYAQFGAMPPSAKPWKGEGPGVFEVVEDYRGDTYRAVYTVRFAEAVYALHVFQKKSPKGIKTRQSDVDLVKRRLKEAQRQYEEQYGQGRE